MTIDERIDELAAALGAGLRPPGEVPWERLERELQPLALPTDLRRLWERVDVTQLGDAPYPRPSAPAFALEGWRELRDDPLLFPAGLFPWCYESHGHLLIELDAPGAATGTIFEWGFGDQTFRLRYHDLGDWLRVTTELIRGREAVPPAYGPHPVYGTETEFSTAPGAWPAHWRSVAELAFRDPPVRFAARTVAEVLAARRAGPVEATVTVRAHWVDGTRYLLSDATGQIDVHCPPWLRGRGLLSGTPPFVVEIEATHWTGPEPRLAPWPFGEPVPAGAVPPDRAALLERLAPQATATIVRRT